jgi:2-polyprenyl-3-methyl-5-hydroxy-6-metoxy-1,4-benzoquinol methylase
MSTPPGTPTTRYTPPWHGLEGTGVQEFKYAEVTRTDLHTLFDAPPRRVLDIGCGAGAVGLGIKKAFPGTHVWGCELDARAAEIARGRLDRVSTDPTAEWNEAALAALGMVDTVMLLDVLEHMYNPWAEMQRLARHLADDAQVIISLPNVGHMSLLRDLANGYWHYKPYGLLDITHLRFFTEYEMTRLIYQTGFRVEKKMYMATGKPQAIERFPINLDLGEVRLKVRDQAHWLSLHALQIGFRARKAPDAALDAREQALRHAPHPKTHAY